MEDQKNAVKLEDKRLEQVVGGLVEKDGKKEEKEINQRMKKKKVTKKIPGKIPHTNNKSLFDATHHEKH